MIISTILLLLARSDNYGNQVTVSGDGNKLFGVNRVSGTAQCIWPTLEELSTPERGDANTVFFMFGGFEAVAYQDRECEESVKGRDLRIYSRSVNKSNWRLLSLHGQELISWLVNKDSLFLVHATYLSFLHKNKSPETLEVFRKGKRHSWSFWQVQNPSPNGSICGFRPNGTLLAINPSTLVTKSVKLLDIRSDGRLAAGDYGPEALGSNAKGYFVNSPGSLKQSHLAFYSTSGRMAAVEGPRVQHDSCAVVEDGIIFMRHKSTDIFLWTGKREYRASVGFDWLGPVMAESHDATYFVESLADQGELRVVRVDNHPATKWAGRVTLMHCASPANGVFVKQVVVVNHSLWMLMQNGTVFRADLKRRYPQNGGYPL